MKDDLFRKEVVEKITGPEDLNNYIKILNPRIWLIIISIALIIAGLVIFTSLSGFPVWDLFFGEIAGQ